MIVIREERVGEEAAIRSLHLAAFPTPTEADLVEQLRRDGDTVISLVAIIHGKVVGHVLFSRMSVEADGRELIGLGLAPLAVVPDRQRTGIGSALVQAGIAKAESTGAQIIFVLGEPAYYGRFGFDAKCAERFVSPYAGAYLQARMLGSASRPVTGRADYARAFADLG